MIDANTVAVGLLVFANTVATGASGSGRLIDASAPQIAALTLQANGGRVWVQSVLDSWHWDPASTLTPDNITICNPTANGVNPGRFIRDRIPALEWMFQLTWSIDPVSGSDENTGINLANAIKTEAERARRFSKIVLFSMTVTYESAPPTADALTWDNTLAPGVILTIQGTPTVNGSGTLTAVQATNRATPVMANVTDGAQTFTGWEGKFATITGVGANAGAVFAIAKVIAATNVRTSSWGTVNLATGAFTRKVLVNTDPYQITTPVTVPLGLMRFTTTDANNGSSQVVLLDLKILDGGNNGCLEADRCLIIAKRCEFAGVYFISNLAIRSAGCVFSGQTSIIGSSWTSRACVNFGSMIASGGIQVFDFDFLHQGASAALTIQPQSTVETGSVAVFDTAGFVTIRPDGGIWSQVLSDGVDVTWGATTSGFAVNVQSGGNWRYATKPTLNAGLGAGRETQIGGTGTLWALVPFINPANNASIVLTA